MRGRATITCICCGRTGPSHGRRLILTCYSRNLKRGTLDQYPLVISAKQWQPARSDSRRMVDRYRQLAAIRPTPSKTWIAWELGVTVRSVERYAAAARAEQATTETQPRTEAA